MGKWQAENENDGGEELQRKGNTPADSLSLLGLPVRHAESDPVVMLEAVRGVEWELARKRWPGQQRDQCGS
jgi:hypothetical protein